MSALDLDARMAGLPLDAIEKRATACDEAWTSFAEEASLPDQHDALRQAYDETARRFGTGRCARGVRALITRLRAAEARAEGYRAALWLCAAEFAFARTEPSGYHDIHAQLTEGEPRIVICCSDTFAYASADGEWATYPQARDVLDIASREGWPGIVRWVAAHRAGDGDPPDPVAPVRDLIARHDDLRAQRDEARAALRAAEARTAWQPIETAPADVEVIVRVKTGSVWRVREAVGSVDRLGWIWRTSDGTAVDARHWAPIPAAPEAT